MLIIVLVGVFFGGEGCFVVANDDFANFLRQNQIVRNDK